MRQTANRPKPGELITTSSKYDLFPGGYRFVQWNGYQVLVRILKAVNHYSWRTNNGLGRRRHRTTYKCRVVDPGNIQPILDASDTIRYGDSSTVYIQKLKYPIIWKGVRKRQHLECTGTV